MGGPETPWANLVLRSEGCDCSLRLFICVPSVSKSNTEPHTSHEIGQTSGRKDLCRTAGGFNEMGTKLLELPKRRVSVATVGSDK